MNELAELRDRLRTLEQRQRRLRAWCAASGALWIAACLAAVAAPASDELRTRRLVLVDEQGAERGRLDCDADGAALTLKSRDGVASVQLAATTAAFGGTEKAAMLELASLDSSLFLMAREKGAGVVAEAGDEPWSVLNLLATEIGAQVSGSFQDEMDFDLTATPGKARLLLTRGSELVDPDEALPEVELGLENDAGRLVLRRGDTQVFRAPE